MRGDGAGITKRDPLFKKLIMEIGLEIDYRTRQGLKICW